LTLFSRQTAIYNFVDGIAKKKQKQQIIPSITVPCYRGMVRGGDYKLKGGTGLATIAFRLNTTDTHFSATVG
jgi:hypothetical protein